MPNYNFSRKTGVIIILLFLIPQIVTFAKDLEPFTGPVKGKIVSENGTPVAGATVLLKEIARQAVADDNGSFSIQNVPAGSYQVEVSHIGFKTYSEKIKVKETGAELRIILTSQNAQLTEITITAGVNKFNKKETDDIARLPLRNIENPQVYSIVTKEIMAEQVVTNYNSIFKNIPGTGVATAYNQGRSAFLSRGFVTANLIRNSISGFVYTNIDPANLEVMEAIKGPSGTLFNSSQISFGGLFNRVTKKPLDYNRTEIAFAGGGYNLNRLTVDINRKMNKDNTALMRINGALHTEQGFQDYGFSRNAMLAPSFSFKLSSRLSILLDIEASMFNATSPVRFAPFTGKADTVNIKDYGLGYKRSYLTNSLDYKTQQVNTFGQINYKLSEQWKLQTNITRTYSATKGYVTQLIGATDSTLRQRAQKENFPYNGTEIQQNLVGDFQIGSLRNRMVIGVDYYNQRSDRNTPTVTLNPINFKKPGVAYNYFNADKVDSAAARSTTIDNYRTNIFTYSAYISNVLNITPQLNVMLSLRADRFEDKGRYDVAYDTAQNAYTQNTLSPKLGIVYEVVDERLSLFGNYMNGFNNTGGSDFFGNSFKPQQANQWEVGVKADVLNHRLNGTISYYDISVDNTTRTDPAHPGFSIQNGTQVSRGIEAEIISNPIGGLNIVAGYAYNNSKFTNADSSVNGLRPAESGPEHLGNIWLSYRLLKGKVRGLGFGIGGNYGSASFQTNQRKTSKTQNFQMIIPSYTIFDATVFYDAPTFRIGLKLDNLTNEQYWSFRLAPQMPRRLTANIAFRF